MYRFLFKKKKNHHIYSFDGEKPQDPKKGNKIVYSKVKLTQYNIKALFYETLEETENVEYKNTEIQNKS